MKELKLKINACIECPYREQYFHGMSNYSDHCRRTKNNKEIPDIRSIPDWCPL